MPDAEAVQVDSHTFHNRLSHFLSQWKNDRRSGDAIFQGATSISIVVGKTEETSSYQKHNSFQYWLLGYEFPATLFLLTTETIYVVTTKKKAAYLEPLKGGKVPIEILTRGKDAEENNKIFERCLDIIKQAGKKHGVISKVQPTGPFAEEWQKSYETISQEVEEVDITSAISAAAMSVKDETELRLVRDAARASAGILQNYFVEEMSEILDEEKKVSHKDLADKCYNKIDDIKFLQDKIKVSKEFDPSQIDWAYPPVIQSGGVYDLKLDAQNDDKNLHAGVILAHMGIRYQNYASLISRTFLVDPNKSQENNYKLLLAAHEAAIKAIKDGVLAKDVYEKAVGIIKARKPDLESKFLKNVGFGIGIENRDGSLVLNSKNSRILRDGMTLVVTTGFSELDNPDAQSKKSSTYSIVVSDTVRVTTGDTAVFTKDAPTDTGATSFFFRDDEDDKPAQPKPKKDPRAASAAQNNITKTRLRGERQTNQDAEKEAKRKEHQREVHAKKQREGLERYQEGTGSLNGVEEKKFKRFESYKRDDQFPSKTKDLVICVDPKASSLVLPILGRPVPFHINTVKNASTTQDGGYTFLRINFLSPGQGVGRKDDQPFEDPEAHFVRSLTFRSKDADRFGELTNQITEMKKSSVRREQEKKELEDVVEQDKLIEIRNKRPPRMEPVFVRPSLEGKRLAGFVEIHQNGLRYQHPTGQRVDILFSNVKHLFFQPCDHELIVLIHVFLVNPIMVAKRKTRDIQFYREATEMAVDETGNRKRRHRFGDEEEFEAEQEERRRRAQLNREFKAFTERISDAGRGENVSVDIPFRELGFNGVHARSSVLIQPSTDCLVQLTEPPFLVVTLGDIEVVHLERVQFGLKNFDMVVVFRDFQRSPIHINTIPVEALDGVKDWLDSVDIPFSDGPLNLNWATIMKTVTADPHAFFAEGGWSFLGTDSDEEGGGSEDEEEEESAFEMSDSEVAGLSDEESGDGSEFDDDASASVSEAEPEDLSDEGESWDEMEKKNAKKDAKSGLDDEGTKSGGSKRKR